MDWQNYGQHPNNLLALLGRKAIHGTDDYREIAKRLERLRREGYCTDWEMKICPTQDKANPFVLKVVLERKRNNG